MRTHRGLLLVINLASWAIIAAVVLKVCTTGALGAERRVVLPPVTPEMYEAAVRDAAAFADPWIGIPRPEPRPETLRPWTVPLRPTPPAPPASGYPAPPPPPEIIVPGVVVIPPPGSAPPPPPTFSAPK